MGPSQETGNGCKAQESFILYYTVLYYIILYFIELYYIVLYYNIVKLSRRRRHPVPLRHGDHPGPACKADVQSFWRFWVLGLGFRV